jgi:type IV pilus assembly protein PilB
MEPIIKPIGQILKEMDLVSEGQIQEALAIQREKGGMIGDILVKLGYISKDHLMLGLASQMGMEMVNLDEMEIPEEVIQKVSEHMARIYNIIPIRFEDNTITIAMADPYNINVMDDLRTILGCEVKGAVCAEEEIERALKKYYGDAGGLDEFFSTLREEDIQFEVLKSEKTKAHDIEDMVNAPPVKKLLNLILLHALKEKSSDIHFEPFENDFKVRYRVDGVLYEMQAPPKQLALPLISRIKVMANLDIAESRLPQDGKILLTVQGRPVDLRVSTLPTIHGESVVMRILDRSVVNLDLDNIGFRDEELKLMKDLINLPHGIIIVTGPTGCGKTTTLYAALSYANDVKWKIITTEDPVEYEIDGLVQCQVNEEIGVTFANLLRSILRQDPDTILVGEIRDFETAQLAIEASLTGHLVFSTLHTNDAPGAITRLLDLGVESYLICATIEAIVAQRLVRRICTNCKEEIEPTEEMLLELGLTPADVKGKKFCWGRGCERCNNTGYKGRMAIFEIMLMTDKIKELVMQHASTEAIRIAAREQGMRSLRESGLLAIYDGHTTIEEVVRETLFTG